MKLTTLYPSLRPAILAVAAAAALMALPSAGHRQEAPAATPTEHVLGTITGTDAAAKNITVKEDKTGVETVISVGQTRSIFRVQPGAKDLKGATRITSDDLNTGDRVDIRGSKDSEGSGVIARSVVLMSATDLAQKHQQEAELWQNSTVGAITAIDASAHSLTVSVRGVDGAKSVTVQTNSATAFTRYSVHAPKVPRPTEFASLQPGDQVHIIGQKSEDGASIAAEKVYSAAARTIAATVTAVAADTKQLTVRDLQNKQAVTVLITEDSAIRKLPPEMAAMLARRFNPGARPAGAAGPATGGNWQASGQHGGPAGASAGGPPSDTNGPSASAPAGFDSGGPAGRARTPRGGGGDLSRMLERVPLTTVADLKPGDAVVIWGIAGSDPNTVAAHVVLAGVEPVLQSAPPRQGQSLNANWNLDMSVPAQ